MTRQSLLLATQFFVFVLIQIPLIYRVHLFDYAFGFFYIGFLILLPPNTSRVLLMLSGFLCGFLIDTFSNTISIHAGACVLIMFLRNIILKLIYPEFKSLKDLNHITLGSFNFFLYLSSMLLIFCCFIFIVENGGLSHFGILITKILMSASFSTLIIYILMLLTIKKTLQSS